MTTTILVGDARERLKELPDESVHCVVTSPPYFGLRAYGGQDGMIGLEGTLDEYLDSLAAVFAEVRRLLRRDGTLWLNLGDSYAGSGTTGTTDGHMQPGSSGARKTRRTPTGAFKPKDLMMLPARAAMRLQADGWWLRSEIVWHKAGGLPESVKDRPVSNHEKLYLLARSRRYFYDADAVREEMASAASDLAKMYEDRDRRSPRPSGGDLRVSSAAGRIGRKAAVGDPDKGRSLRNVWTLPCAGYPGAHFAVMPERLVEPCISAGSPLRCCSACGAPGNLDAEVTSCCGAKHGRGVVLDPFAGAGTVGLVADKLGRDSILIELDPSYAEMAAERIRGAAPLLARVEMR